MECRAALNLTWFRANSAFEGQWLFFSHSSRYPRRFADVGLDKLNDRLSGKEFAKAMGYLAKTDRIDAKALAELAQVLNQHPERNRFVTVLPTPEQQVLQALVARRRQLVSMHVAERYRLPLSHVAARPSIKAMIAAIRVQIDEIEDELAKHIEVHHAELAKYLASVRGKSVRPPPLH